LPRLKNTSVLVNAVCDGVSSNSLFCDFAYADEYDVQTKRYSGLKFGERISLPSDGRDGLIVKIEAAQKQSEEEAQRKAAASQGSGVIPPGGTGSGVTGTPIPPMPGPGGIQGTPPQPAAPKNTRFFMSTNLDNIRIGRDVQNYVDNIISHLTSVDGAQVEISLELTATFPNGFTQQTVRTVSENCQTLQVKDFGFEE
jgi:hypothetical protein